MPRSGWYREVFNTDSTYYGGNNIGNPLGATAEDVAWHGRPHSLKFTLPPLSTVVFQPGE